MGNKEFKNLGGGATPLSRQGKGSGDIRWKKILRYYGTKIVRGNSRISKSDLQYVILNCLRQDNTLNIGGTYHVILNLFQDLKRCTPAPRISNTRKLMLKFNPRPQGVRVSPLSEAHRKHTPHFTHLTHSSHVKQETLKRVLGDKDVCEAHSKFLVPYCLSNLVSSKKTAFTLAEVLITLGIIGIVAAMTIPTLISNYQKKITVSKLQKAHSTLSNMTKLLYADGVYNAFSGTVSSERTEQFFNSYVLPYFKSPVVYKDRVCPYTGTTEDCFPFKYPNNDVVNSNVKTIWNYGRIYFTTSDKTSYFMSIMNYVDPDLPDADRVYKTSPTVWVDLNGTDGPNTVGKDVFYFKTDFSTGMVYSNCASKNYEYINRECSRDGQGLCCAAKIMLDGWKIKDDYPW